MKKILIISAVAIIVLLLIGILLFFFIGDDNIVECFGQEIEFSQTTDVNFTSNTNLEYSVDKLSSQLSKNTTYSVLYNPILTDYKIVSQFGFDIDNYSLWDDGRRSYSADGPDKEKKLTIDKYGCFSYTTGVGSATFEMPIDDNECYNIAKKYLQEQGLYSKRLGKDVSYNKTELYSLSEGTKVTAVGVNFLVDNTYGNARIMVEINGNGEVISVTNSVREYSDSKKVKLISVKEAIERFKEGNAFIEVENPSSNLKFEKVSVKYWSQERNDDNLFVQPVYYFEGTSTTTDGKTEPFSIAVQANRY